MSNYEITLNIINADKLHEKYNYNTIIALSFRVLLIQRFWLLTTQCHLAGAFIANHAFGLSLGFANPPLGPSDALKQHNAFLQHWSLSNLLNACVWSNIFTLLCFNIQTNTLQVLCVFSEIISLCSILFVFPLLIFI